MLESLEQLHKEIETLNNITDTDVGELERIAEAIEREIEEYYMELPTDEDGVPIHIGDKLSYGDKEIEAKALTSTQVFYYQEPEGVLMRIGRLHVRHYDPVKDLLEKFATERIKLFLRTPMAVSDEGIEEYRTVNNEACKKLIDEYAAKLQLREAE